MDPYQFSLLSPASKYQLSSLIQFPTTSLTTTATLFNKSLLKKFFFVLQEFSTPTTKIIKYLTLNFFLLQLLLTKEVKLFLNGTKTSSVQILLTKSGIGRQSNVLSTVFFLLFSWSIFHLKSIRLVFGFSILGHTIWHIYVTKGFRFCLNFLKINRLFVDTS